MIRSMTGFARVREALPDGEVVLSVKSVNHRGLDLHFHSPAEFDPYETALRAVAKRFVVRGHLDVRIFRTRSAATSASGWNRPLMEAYLAAFREASEAYSISGHPDLNIALRLPGMLGESAETDVDASKETEALVTSLMERALKTLNEFREREGAELRTAMLERNQSIAGAVVKLESIRERALASFQARLSERLANLLGTVGIEPQRLAQEAAILADRSDIGEEIARLKIHSAQLETILNAGGETGKKLDFLLQEMNREANTILSKTSGVGETGLDLTDIAIGVKSDIEKIREQALNLE